jgi:hypothetical protein
MDNTKLLEVQQILNSRENINNSEKIKKYYKKYKKELEEFKYIEDDSYLYNNKKLYIKYIDFNNKLHYGGFFYKLEKKNKTTYIYLISSQRKVWYIDFNKNFIFVNKVISNNDKIRNMFINFLDKNIL